MAQTFWDHLDILRTVIVRIAVAILVCGIVAFCLKDSLFALIFAPKSSDFITYRLLQRIGIDLGAYDISLINTGLTRQFMTHIEVSLYAGVLCASPYILYSLFGFVAPALYQQERRVAIRALTSSFVLFWAGVLVSYFLIFPLTFRFLATYEVSAVVSNMIALDSYLGTLTSLTLLMGLMFELPVLCWILASMGIIDSRLMCQYRRHAIVAILITAAVITPSGDAITLFVVALPIYLLYELSIGVIRSTVHRV